MYSDIDQITPKMMDSVYNLYIRHHSFEEIMDIFDLSRNELLCILEKKGVSNKELIKHASSYQIYDKALVISDTHLGSINDNLNYINAVYNYAITNEITDIIHTGDLLEGMPKSKKNMTYSDQINYLLNNYPSIDGIHTYFIGGNHDYKFNLKGYDIDKLIPKERSDFHYLGTSKGYILLNDKLLFLSHKNEKYHLEVPNFEHTYGFKGHSHFYKKNKLSFNVPMLSDDYLEYPSCFDSYPGFLLLEDKQHLVVKGFKVKEKDGFVKINKR